MRRMLCSSPAIATTILLAALVVAALGQEKPGRTPTLDGGGSYPVLVTARTRADRDALARLEKPGKLLFQDGFESPDSLKNYFEIQGLKTGRARLVNDPALAHTGSGALQLTAPGNDGKESGAGASYWFGPGGFPQVYFRRYIKFAADYDQGPLHHVGGSLAGVAGTNKWGQMGKAGIRPSGDDRFTSSFEPWRAWSRYDPPGYMFLYTYWMDMKRDRDGRYWGNNLNPADEDRLPLQRDRWYCLEHMIKVNDLGEANGELAAWIDGKLYIHYRGFRWRTAEDLKIKRLSLGVYVHRAAKDNTVWYDDAALSTGYIGPIEKQDRPGRRPAASQSSRGRKAK